MKRIQRKRTKGWRMPDNALYVGRPSKWGNPLMLVGDTLYVDASYRRKVLFPWAVLSGKYADASDMMHYFWLVAGGKIRRYVNPDLQYWSDHFAALDYGELWGKDLACWCPLTTQHCHADILIELAQKYYEDKTR